MILTEEQATEKWCPMSRVDLGHYSPNRSQYANLEGTNCLGSNCMFWKWSEIPDPLPKESREEALGYCGLVGK